MEKIFFYIKQGRGRGFIFLLAAAVLMTLLLMFSVKQMYSAVQPQILMVADEILPITVQEGKVVSPENAYKRLEINFGEDEKSKELFPIVLDTRGENVHVPEEKQGLFILRDKVYVVTQGQIHRYDLKDGVIDRAVFEKFLDYMVNSFSVVVSLFMIGIFFVMLLAKTLIVSGLCVAGEKVFHWSKSPFDSLLRLSSLLVAVVDVIAIGLSLLSGFMFPPFFKITVALAFAWLFLYSQQNNKVA